MAESAEKTVSVEVNHTSVQLDPDTTYGDLVESHRGHENGSPVTGVRVDGTLKDLRDHPEDGEQIEFLTFEDPEGRSVYWHTTAHILAQAVKRYIDGEVKLGVGPPIDEGFFYDFDLPRTLSEDELYHIEGIMKQIINEDYELSRRYLPSGKAREELAERGEEYKVQLVEDLEGEPSFYRQAEFEDLCAGPHLFSTGEVGAVKLTKVSAAYWKGEEDNPEMQRIYGISFPTQEELEAYEKRIEEAKKRDHRRLGPELDLFHIEDEVGPGLVIWHPRGGRIRNTIESYWRDMHLSNGYELVNTPHLAREELWETSGHLSHYAENMFPGLEMDEEAYRVKPMNCPFHMKIFNADTRSYRDLPMRLAELGTVYRYERSGVLHGLLRVRGFTQDDAHVFCTPDQVETELIRVLDLITEVLSTFGFDDYEIFVSTQPDDFVGSQDRWDLATQALKDALESQGLEYDIDPGEGVYYGPKIDLKIRDSLDREWQCSTIQVDFNLPERFDIEYVSENGEHRRPIMIHRALFGSLERFFGCLVEHYGGAFPPWLAPTPVWILPVSDQNVTYAERVQSMLEEKNIRCRITRTDDTLGKRIRRSQTRKIPYAFIVGSDEESDESVEVRPYGREGSQSMALSEAVEHVRQAIDQKRTIHDETP